MKRAKPNLLLILSLFISMSSCLVTGQNAASGKKAENNNSATDAPLDNSSQDNTNPPNNLPTPAPSPSSPGPDPLEMQAWHLINNGQSSFSKNGGVVGEDINQVQAHTEGIIGLGVRIAVSDNGTEISHEDLSINHLPGESRNYSSSSPADWAAGGNPSPTENEDIHAHGTAVTGLIAAAGANSLGSRGIAPGAKFAAFKYVGTDASISKDIDQANGNFDIFNYSYGRNSCAFADLPDSYMAQLKFGVTSLRGGRGVHYIKAAGNEYRSSRRDCSSNANGNYYGNANLEEDASSGFVLVVGANTASGISAGYSTPGSSLWISAPGGDFGIDNPAMVSTDLMGCNRGMASAAEALNDFDGGANPLNPNCNYTSTMNGTSSATPVMAGAIALILQANPNLTWRDVRFILAKTARKIDPNRGDTPHPDGANLNGHIYQLGWIVNGAGFNFHNWYGFGAVDVDAAVAMAKNYTTNLGNFIETNFADDSGALNLSVPDNSAIGIESNLNVTTDIEIEAVQIKVTIDHTFAGDLGLELTSPMGTKSKLLLINSNILEARLDDVLLLSNSFYGERSGGTWTLKVVDGAAQDLGTLTNWKINFHGHNPIGIASISLANNETSKSKTINEEVKPTKTQISIPDIKENGRLVVALGTKNDLILASSNNSKESFFSRHRRDGMMLWKYDFPLADQVNIKQIQQGPKGESYFIETSEAKVFLGKVSRDGELLWRHFIGLAQNAVLHFDSDMIWVGSESFLNKYDSDGGLIWTRSLENRKDSSLKNLMIDPLGQIYLYGDFKTERGDRDIFINVFTNNGKLKNKENLGTKNDEEAGTILVDKKGYLYLSLSTEGNFGEESAGGKDIVIIKLDLELNKLWIKQFGAKLVGVGAIGNEEAGQLTLGDDGDLYFASSTEDNFAEVNSGGKDIFVIRLTDKGQVKWISQAGFSRLKERAAGNEIVLKIKSIKDRLLIIGQTDGSFARENLARKKEIIFIEFDKEEGRIIP